MFDKKVSTAYSDAVRIVVHDELNTDKKRIQVTGQIEDGEPWAPEECRALARILLEAAELASKAP